MLGVWTQNGFCIGHVEWDWKRHHATVFRFEGRHLNFELAPVREFAPWELGYVGAPVSGSHGVIDDRTLDTTTPPMACTFDESNVPLEVSSACAGPLQCIRTNGDGLGVVHSVFGVVRDAGYRLQTELYHNDAKAFIRDSFGTDYMSFSHRLDNPYYVLAEL